MQVATGTKKYNSVFLRYTRKHNITKQHITKQPPSKVGGVLGRPKVGLRSKAC